MKETQIRQEIIRRALFARLESECADLKNNINDDEILPFLIGMTETLTEEMERRRLFDGRLKKYSESSAGLKKLICELSEAIRQSIVQTGGAPHVYMVSLKKLLLALFYSDPSLSARTMAQGEAVMKQIIAELTKTEEASEAKEE